MKKIFWMLFAAAAWSGCSDDKTTEGSVDPVMLSISAGELAFDADGNALSDGVDQVTVQSSGSWRLGGRQEWAVPSADRGEPGDIVTFAVAPNEELEDREVTFTFMCGDREQRLTIIQEAGSQLGLEQDEFEIADTGGEFRLRVFSTGEASYRFTEEVDWIHQVETRAVGLAYYYFTVDPNATGIDRTANLIVTNSDGDEHPVSVMQHKNLLLEISETSFNVPIGGAEVSVLVKSNLQFRLEPTVDWIRLKNEPVQSDELQTQELVFEVEAAGTAFRSGAVNVTAISDPELITKLSFIQGERPEGIDFPDEAFRNALVEAGYIEVLDGTECLLTEAGEAATRLPDLYRNGITSLKGIEAFRNLTTLEPNGIGENPIRELDLSGNPRLTTIDWKSVMGGYRSYLTPAPLEVLKFGDAPIADGRVFLSNLYCSSPTVYAQSLTVSGNSVKTIELSLSYYDQVKELDMSGCPNIRNVTLNSYYVKTLYVSRQQKDAIDAKEITVTDSNYPTSDLSIVIRE